MLFSAGSLQRRQGDACVVKKKVGRGESSGGDEPHDREGVGAEDSASQQQQQSQETDLNGAQNSHVSNVNDSSEGGGGTVTNAGNSNSTGGGEGGDDGNSNKDLYDPFASTDSDTDSVSAKKAQEAENRRNAENRKLEQQRHQEEEEESDEFSDIEPPPPEKKPPEEDTRKEGTIAGTGVTGQEKYDPMDPTDDPSPAPTPPAFTPMDDDDRSQDTDLSAPPFSPPSPGLPLAKDSLPNDDDDDDEEPMGVDEEHPKDGAAVAKRPNRESSRESEDEDPGSSTPDAPQNFDPPSLSEIPLPEG